MAERLGHRTIDRWEIRADAGPLCLQNNLTSSHGNDAYAYPPVPVAARSTYSYGSSCCPGVMPPGYALAPASDQNAIVMTAANLSYGERHSLRHTTPPTTT